MFSIINQKIINQKIINQKIINEQIKNEQIKNERILFYNKSFKSIIPLKIYQVWHSTELPDSVKYCVENIKTNNPEFEYNLFNINECRDFIKDNFSIETLTAFDSIIPNAIKIDLWRYCMLYKNGGIYLDIKYYCINKSKLIYLTDNEYFCKDIESSNSGIYNALIICKPQNEIMLLAINKVIENVKKNFYGENTLEPTGPLMLKKFFTNDDINNLNLKLNLNNSNNKETLYISYNNCPILFFHNNYKIEQKQFQKHWSEYWHDRQFYNNFYKILFNKILNSINFPLEI